MYNGAPTLFLDGAPVFAGMQWLSGLVEPDGSATNDDAIRAFAAAGIHLNAFTIGEEWRGPRPGHPDPFDFSRIEPVFRAIVAADPQAMFHLRIYLETASWWNEMHPDECEVSDGNRLQMSYASPVWQAEVKDHLRRLIAYQVCPGVCGEWVKKPYRDDTADGRLQRADAALLSPVVASQVQQLRLQPAQSLAG